MKATLIRLSFFMFTYFTDRDGKSFNFALWEREAALIRLREP